METTVQPNALKIRGIDDVIAYLDSRQGIKGRAAVIWWLALGGLFLDAFSNSALSAGLGPMTRNLSLSAAQVALMTSMASWVAIAFNPIGGWMADRWGRIRPLILAKVLAVTGAVREHRIVDAQHAARAISLDEHEIAILVAAQLARRDLQPVALAGDQAGVVFGDRWADESAHLLTSRSPA